MHTYMHAYIHTYTHAYMHTYMYRCIQQMHVYNMYTHVLHIHMRIYGYTYICTYTSPNAAYSGGGLPLSGLWGPNLLPNDLLGTSWGIACSGIL